MRTAIISLLADAVFLCGCGPSAADKAAAAESLKLDTEIQCIKEETNPGTGSFATQDMERQCRGLIELRRRQR